MVEYEYPELFYEHASVHLIIVDSLAEVTPVANEPPTITNEDFIITEHNIQSEKFALEESICSEDDLTFGLCESSRVSFTMYSNPNIPSLEDKEITIYLYFNNDSSTLFKVGNYIIEEDDLSVNRKTRNVSGYDYLYYLRDYDITEWYNDFYAQHGTSTIKTIRDSLFNWLWNEILEFDAVQETVDLPNDSYLLEKSIESDVVTFGFFMQGIMEINGVFGHVNRDGLFSYISLDLYDNDPAATITGDIIIPNVQYKDWNTWGIGYVAVYDRNNNRIARIGNSAYRHPSVYSVVDSFVFSNNERRANWKQQLETAVSNMREAVTHRRYRSCTVNCLGSLCLEVGDRIDVTWNEYDNDGTPIVKSFKTYILERRFKGIQGFKDTYTAKGNKKQPKYKTGKSNDNWHVGDNQINTVNGVEGIAQTVSSDDFVEIIRNIGFRLLDEPSNVSVEYEGEEQISESVFANGSFNNDLMVSGFDIDNYKISLYPIQDGHLSPISDLSSWYLTPYTLVIGMSNGKRMTKDSKYILRSGSVNDDFAGAITYLPIRQRHNIRKIRFDIALANKKSSSPYNTGKIRSGYVSNGEFIETELASIGEPPVGSFQTIELDVNIPVCDYIGIEWNDGIPYIDNLVIVHEQ